MRRKCDLSKGIEQCKFVRPNLDEDGWTCCGLEVGHDGSHEDWSGYQHGRWVKYIFCECCGHVLGEE